MGKNTNNRATQPKSSCFSSKKLISTTKLQKIMAIGETSRTVRFRLKLPGKNIISVTTFSEKKKSRLIDSRMNILGDMRGCEYRFGWKDGRMANK